MQDNPTLMALETSYQGSLSAMFEYERTRRLLGNLFARTEGGVLFKTVFWVH